MKSVLLIMCLFLLSCGKDNTGTHESIEAVFYVENVYEAKYSGVYGYIYYDGFKIPVDNGGSGYYYKKYNLAPGDKILTTIDKYTRGTKHGYEVFFSDVNVSAFEIKSK